MGKGFKYSVDKEKLLAYMKLSTEEKLRWLYEANWFIRTFTTDKEKRIIEEFRRGER
jgi:hypothetical protein